MVLFGGAFLLPPPPPPLQDVDFFSKATVDKELETVVWPNGADFAPEFLYFKAFGDEAELQAQFEAWGYKA